MGKFKRLKRLNSSRIRLEQVNADFARTVPSGSLVLDAGAGEAPYRGLFDHARYESADFQMVDRPYAPSTYVCDLCAIPVEKARFDAVIFNQVMEHLPEPSLVLSELNRVLKPGGRMIYTGPLFFEEHEQPYDFFRYTRFGLTHLFSRAGFEIESLEWMEGYYGTIGYQLRGMADYLPRERTETGRGAFGALAWAGFFLLRPLCMLGSMFFHQLEIRAKYTARGYPKNYVAILRKPAALVIPVA